jgi:hypothetical protein
MFLIKIDLFYRFRATNNENLPATDDDELAPDSPAKNSKKVVGCCNIL